MTSRCRQARRAADRRLSAPQSWVACASPILDNARVKIASLDHVVLTVADIEATIAFYERVLGMCRVHPSTPGPPGIAFGNQKINLHAVGKELWPRAARATAGSADVCFLLEGPLEPVLEELAALEVPIEEGPIERVGAQGRMMSVYFRDPDGNLLEVAELL